MKKKLSLQQYLRCLIIYYDINNERSLHFAVNSDFVDNFLTIVYDTFVHPDVRFTDIIYSYDNRDFFNLI